MKNRENNRLSEKEIFVSPDKKYVLVETIDSIGSRKVTKIFRKNSKNSVTIIPLINTEELILIRQYRPAIREGSGVRYDGFIYEFPGGKLESKEAAEEAALRELEEETGYRAERMLFLYKHHIAPWFTNSVDFVYLATDMHKTKTRRDSDEIIDVYKVSLDKMCDMIRKGGIVDIASSDAFLHWFFLDRKKPRTSSPF